MLSSNLKSLHQLLNYSFFLSTYWLLIEFSLSAIPIPPQSIEARAPWFGQLTIEWIDDSIDEESYALEYRTDPASEWITLSTLSPTSRSSNLSSDISFFTISFFKNFLFDKLKYAEINK